MNTQTDPNAAYNAKVREIAKKLANKEIDTQLASGRSVKLNLTTSGLDKRINKHMLGARAMVAEMAKEYEHDYFSNYDGDEGSPCYELWNQNCIDEMQERGLIPSIPNTKTTDEEDGTTKGNI